MTRVLDQSKVLKELEAVSAKLDAGKVKGEQRLVLLRRQASLCDLRDALADNARRAQS